MSLFERRDFTSHSGLALKWKVECDALSGEEWAGLAQIGAEKLAARGYRFGRAVGIPRGGLPLAAAMAHHVTPGAPGLLVCDDVLTTGRSFREFDPSKHQLSPGTAVYGLVAFDRSDPREKMCPPWVVPIWRI